MKVNVVVERCTWSPEAKRMVVDVRASSGPRALQRGSAPIGKRHWRCEIETATPLHVGQKLKLIDTGKPRLAVR